MAIDWNNVITRKPTIQSAFNQTSNLIINQLGGNYINRYMNGTSTSNQEVIYEYDYLSLISLNDLVGNLESLSQGQTIDLPDFSQDYSGDAKIKVFIMSYSKTLTGDSADRWTVTINFRRVYE